MAKTKTVENATEGNGLDSDGSGKTGAELVRQTCRQIAGEQGGTEIGRDIDVPVEPRDPELPDPDDHSMDKKDLSHSYYDWSSYHGEE